MKPLKENSASTLAMMAVLKTRLPKRLISSRGAVRFRAPAAPCAGLRATPSCCRLPARSCRWRRMKT